ncbi:MULTISPECIES: hypothetical protein [unclassified Variovorax]|uniref:hypothetical protein n=1 Tax=unclassified Variovorax TaxID=663243 RepID=UPI00076D50C7|nr:MULTISPECIES: hypothetical protein [unclassified Variovorax]KWT89279.1 hypothetical protein APY03_3523 [Variovorax sp. WDL1]PNG46816.1 hypothetical protein CHC06_07159 [Variovorax sp. B2]PNG48533.1 hypothetical protein CHC07_07709 [Variovorax sp. B4]VTV14631.1 hypothetical protein WDL1CHR_05133 [Variovorax sp. WDL1]
MKTILIKEPQFYCYQDEKHFFDWLEGLKALKGMKRTPKGLALTVDFPIDDDSLADLIALLTRYRLDRATLKVFLNESNQKWFETSRAYWYRAVFKSDRTP